MVVVGHIGELKCSSVHRELEREFGTCLLGHTPENRKAIYSKLIDRELTDRVYGIQVFLDKRCARGAAGEDRIEGEDILNPFA